MNPAEPTGNDGRDVPISAAEPYRTPADIADTRVAGGWFRSPITWIVMVAVLSAVGALFVFRGVSQETMYFNESRVPMDDYEVLFEAESALQSTTAAAPSTVEILGRRDGGADSR